MKEKNWSITVTLPDSLLFKIAQYSEQNKVSRSEAIRQVLENGFEIK